jgi:hypothetical protein
LCGGVRLTLSDEFDRSLARDHPHPGTPVESLDSDRFPLLAQRPPLGSGLVGGNCPSARLLPVSPAAWSSDKNA